jgi:hypothetical protein
LLTNRFVHMTVVALESQMIVALDLYHRI